MYLGGQNGAFLQVTLCMERERTFTSSKALCWCRGRRIISRQDVALWRSEKRQSQGVPDFWDSNGWTNMVRRLQNKDNERDFRSRRDK